MFCAELQSWLSADGLNKPSGVEPLGGGNISEAFRLDYQNRRSLFVKQLRNAPPRFFEAEYEGLSYLQSACNLNSPEVLGYGERFIVMRYIYSGKQRADFWENLAQQLALMHRCQREEFGFINDNYCGKSPQKNPFSRNGYEFFAEHRLLFQAERAFAAGKLDERDRADVVTLCKRLPVLIPEQRASLLHGDLWSGNVMVSAQGEPVFIDPAVYFGWAESDLAMTLLFGGFPEQFYAAYCDGYPMLPGWRKRAEIYNLYHLLNHLNLFGGAYYQEVRHVLDRYS